MISTLRDAILESLRPGFVEAIRYGMLTYEVSHEVHPPGYHCDPSQGVPFVAIASQKHAISLYMLIAPGQERELERFRADWIRTGKKLDMGKCCVRFTRLEDIPLDIISGAINRVSPSRYLARYLAATRQPAKPRQRRKAPARH